MKYITIILAAVLAAPAFADSDKVRNAYVRLDNALNSEYQRALKTLTPESQKKLRINQREWVARRNAECGSPDKPVTDEQVVCLGDMTVERVEALTELADRDKPRQLPGKFSQ